MITKDLFLEVQQQLKVPIKSKWGVKEFPYKQFLRCYSCGSTIVGEEKFKSRLDGSKNRFVYYHCSRQVKLDYKEPYAREQDIVDELSSMCNELITDLGEVEPGLHEAIDKFTKMMKVTQETYSSTEMIGGYIKYVLRDGTLFEKTRLVRNLSIKLALSNRRLVQLSY